ncbi:hypothetical protein CVT26_001845 [Gymnopilus dilepis]|uniref:Novel STAND NTPase 1 domain-containing protein n=1 Tax=Gymnopilus dilepis TaxID=231916 RepID=A0A409VRM4_9AGAR|nr:hypothetical protein CVT26_001845 [Gymnopilus dilepis]
MSAGCFSWCPLKKPRRFKKPVEANSNEESSKDNEGAVPTVAQYAVASGKEVLTILESAAGVIPVPLLQEAIGVALKIIEVCEEGAAVERKVKELQDRVGHLMIVVVENVTKTDGESQEANKQVAKHLEMDIQALLSTLGTIRKDLVEISDQNRWVIAFYKDLNTSTLEACMSRLSVALEKFKLSNDLHNSDLLLELHNRLGKMSHKVNDVSRDMQHVVDKVDRIDDKLEEFHVLVSKSKRSATMLPSSGIDRQQMPLKPEVFYGRDQLVEEIAQMLVNEETSRVCLLGPGGMGKTSISLAVVETPLVQGHFALRSPVWIPCVGATSASLLLETLYVQLQIPGDKKPTLDKIIDELSARTDPCLIVLDNFETPWNIPGETQRSVGDILRQLAQLKHIAMLVTMRGSYPPCDKAIKWQSKNILPTDEEACLRIFHTIHPDSQGDPDVSRLLASLGHMPFAVTLMANLGKEVHWTAQDLLEAWLESGPDLLSDNPEQSMSRSIGLSVDSELVKQNPNAVLLLSILSLLPAGTTVENLRWWAPGLKKAAIASAISTLSKVALLIQFERQESGPPTIFVIPVVQSFMQHQNRVSDVLRGQIHSSCCDYVLEHACRLDDPAFRTKSKAIAVEDTNIHAILFDMPTATQNLVTCDKTMEALIAFCWYRCDTKATLEIVERTLAIAQAKGVERYVAVTTWCLGKSYHQVASYRRAYETLLKAYELFNSLPSMDHMYREFACRCGTELVDAARFVIPREEVVSLAREVEARCATLGNDLIHGRCLTFLGVALQEAQRRQEALGPLGQARALLTAVGNAHHLSQTLQVIARCHYYDMRLSEALEAIEEGWKQAELSDIPFYQAFVSVDFGMILYNLNRDAEAWTQIEIAFMKGSQSGDEHSIVLALDHLGYGYLRRGDYRNALKAYEAASEKWGDTNEVKSEKYCKENIDKIREKQRNPQAVIGFRRPGIDHDDTLFYPPS